MNDLIELQRRKAVLKVRIEQQQLELKRTFQEIREEIEPATLLKKAVGGIFKSGGNKSTDATSGIFEKLPPSLAFLADIFIRDPRMALVVKMLAPMALKLFPKLSKGKKLSAEADDTTPELPAKAKIYGSLRRSIATLRGSLRKKPQKTDHTPETSEN